MKTSTEVEQEVALTANNNPKAKETYNNKIGLAIPWYFSHYLGTVLFFWAFQSTNQSIMGRAKKTRKFGQVGYTSRYR